MNDSHKNSESKLKTRKPELVALRERQRNRNRAVAALGALVVLATVMALMVPAISMTHGDLICGMEEHQHSDACYEKVLVCTQEEGENHTHSDACYESKLICGKDAHTHNDTCYAAPEPEPAAETNRAADQQSGSDTGSANQQPGDQPGVLKNDDGTGQQPDSQPGVLANDGTGADGATAGQGTPATDVSANPEFPAQTFEANLVEKDGDKEKTVLTVSVDAPEGALPDGTTMKIKGVDADKVTGDLKAAISYDANLKGKAQANRSIAVSITFLDADNNKVEPAEDVKVRIWSSYVPEFSASEAELEGQGSADADTAASKAVRYEKPVLIHVLDAKRAKEDGKLDPDGKPMKAEILKDAIIANWDENDKSKGHEDTFKFEEDEAGTFVITELVAADTEDADGQSQAGEGDVDANADGKTLVTTDDPPTRHLSDKLVDGKGNITLTVGVDVPEGALPEGATMQLTPVTKESTLEAAKDAAAAQTDIVADRAEAVAVDITFFDKDGAMVEPKVDVHVTMSAPAAKDSNKGADTEAPTDLAVVHLPEDEAAEVVSTTSADPATATAEFDSSDFSVYALVYTVDFKWEVNGKTYDFSIPGGGFVSFTDLVEVLGIANQDVASKGTKGSTSSGNADAKSADNGNAALSLGDIAISEDTQKFIADVESVTFSNPSLLSVSKVDNDTTVGAIKENLKLECENSAELTEEQIQQIDGTRVRSGDWALISLKPFYTEERLTVALKTGEAFTILVTDAQEDPLNLDGQAFAIVNTKNYSSTAMKPVISNSRLQGDTVTLSQNGNTPTCSDNASLWVFEYVGDGKYYIKSGDLYLKIIGTSDQDWGIELVDREAADPIAIVKTGDTYRFLNDNNISINNYGGTFWAGNWNNSDEQMMLRTPYDPNKPAERATVDSRAQGLTINLFDYGPDDGDHNLDHVNNVLGGGNVNNYWNEGINQYSDLKFFSYGTGYDGTCGINNFTGSSPNHKAAQGIVQNTLEGGYPSLQNDQSLAYLFDGSSRDGKTVYPNVNHLFWNQDGKLRYNSDESYAYYVQGTKDFKVYNTTYEEEGSTDTQTFKVGFFPFNDYDARYQCIHGDDFSWGCNGSNNTHGVYDEVGHFNHHFGLSMTGTFEIVENQDMTFNFSGDDDLWVFVDDVLVLDIGGIHNPIAGSIDFGTTDGSVSVTPNVVAVDGNNNYLAPNTIKAAFEKAGKTWDGSEGSYHEIKVFYLERGGMYSNLEMEINLPLVPSGNLSFNKKDDENAALKGAKFKLYTDEACEHPLSFKSEECVAVADNNGVVTFSGVPTGSYYLKEVEAPVGYELDPTVYQVTIRDKNYPELGSSFIQRADGTPVSDVIDGKKQVVVTLEKQWVGGIPDGATATFALKRLRSYEGDALPAPSTLNVYYVGGVANGDPARNVWDIDNKSKNYGTYTFAGGSTATLSWEYQSWYGNEWTRHDYYVGNEKRTDGPTDVEVDLAPGETTNVYICDGNTYSDWDQGVFNITVNCVAPDEGTPTHVSVTDEEDSAFNANPPTHTFTVGTTDWTYTFPAQAAEALRSDGLVETYKYYIEEVSCSPTGWNVSFSPGALTESGAITATNYRNEVYVEKRWYDHEGNLLEPQPTESVNVTLSSSNSGQISGDSTKDITAQARGVWAVENSGEKLYEATENDVPEGYEVSYSFLDIGESAERTADGVHRGGTIYVNNKQKVGSIQITKTILKNGLANASATGTFYYAVYDEPYSDNIGPEHLIKTDPIVVDENGTSTVTVPNLPYGTYYVYELTEEGGVPIVSGNNGAYEQIAGTTYCVTGSGTSTTVNETNDGSVNLTNNEETEIQIGVLKVDKTDGSTPLAGAKFKLTKYSDENYRNIVQEWDEQEVSAEEATKGTLVFSEIKAGYYELEETQPPAGYVMTGEKPRFTVTVDGSGNLQVTFTNTDMVSYENEVFKVNNEPGKALPTTGGPGVWIFTVLGSTLILGAGALLWRKRQSF